MTSYLDTSIAVAALEGIPTARAWFQRAVAEDSVVSSRLLQTELTRVLRRQGKPVAHRELLLQYVSLAPITDAVLATAEAIPQQIRSLDAIHLATVLQLGGTATVITHDRQMLTAAVDLGLQTHDPLAR